VSKAIRLVRREIQARMDNVARAVLTGGLTFEDYLRATAKVAAYRECLDELTRMETEIMEESDSEETDLNLDDPF